MEKQAVAASGRRARIPDDETNVENANNVAEHPPAAAALQKPAAAGSQQEARGDRNGPHDGESQAASDVAVAEKPEKGKSRKRNRNDDSASEAQARPIVNLTYPDPKNFVERLMGAMQANLAPDSLGWAGEGLAICLNRKQIKTGTFLSDHFEVSSFGEFIRSLNKWGFRQVTHFKVPEGMIAYQSDLFRRDEPHLVGQMKMDSDAQEMNERRAGDQGIPESIEFSEMDGQSSPLFEPTAAELLPHQQQLIQWLNGSGWSAEGATPQLPSQLHIPQQRVPQQPPPPQIPMQLAQNQQSDVLVSSVATLLLQALSQPAAQHAVANARESIYSQIMELCNRYLTLAEISSPVNPCIVMVLKLLQAFDQLRQKPESAQHGQRFQFPMNCASSIQMQQQPPFDSQSQNLVEAIRQLVQQQNNGQVQQAPPSHAQIEASSTESSGDRLQNLFRQLAQAQHSQPRSAAAVSVSSPQVPPPQNEGPQSGSSKQQVIQDVMSLLAQHLNSSAGNSN